jgi:hypothetical protein
MFLTVINVDTPSTGYIDVANYQFDPLNVPPVISTISERSVVAGSKTTINVNASEKMVIHICYLQ